MKPAAALVFNYLLDLLLEADEKRFKHPTALILDEFTNFGFIPGIAKKMTIVRHRKMPVMLGMQDYVQLKSVYGDDDATLLFSQPATRVIFRTPDLATAKKTSESLGQETVVDRKLSTTCQVMEREFGRPLMTAAEVMALDPELSLVFTPATDPLKIRRFSWKDYVDKTVVAPPARKEVAIDQELASELAQEELAPAWEQKLEPPEAPEATKMQSVAEPLEAPPEEQVKVMPERQEQPAHSLDPSMLQEAAADVAQQQSYDLSKETQISGKPGELAPVEELIVAAALACQSVPEDNDKAKQETRKSSPQIEDDDECLPI